MAQGKIKSLKELNNGGWSVQMEDKSGYLCFKEDWNPDLKAGDMIEFESCRQTSKKTGKDWFQMKAPRRPSTGHIPHSAAEPRSNDMMIFVTGVVGRSMGSGKFEISDIPLLALKAVEAWNRLSKPSTAEELDDDIPF